MAFAFSGTWRCVDPKNYLSGIIIAPPKLASSKYGFALKVIIRPQVCSDDLSDHHLAGGEVRIRRC